MNDDMKGLVSAAKLQAAKQKELTTLESATLATLDCVMRWQGAIDSVHWDINHPIDSEFTRSRATVSDIISVAQQIEEVAQSAIKKCKGTQAVFDKLILESESMEEVAQREGETMTNEAIDTIGRINSETRDLEKRVKMIMLYSREVPEEIDDILAALYGLRERTEAVAEAVCKLAQEQDRLRDDLGILRTIYRRRVLGPDYDQNDEQEED